MGAQDVVIVVISHPTEGAGKLAETLVDRRLAACVQVQSGVRSTYRWKDRVETATEVRLEAKTTRGRLPELLAAVAEAHPYEVPEILAVPALDGLPAYLDWVRAETETG